MRAEMGWDKNEAGGAENSKRKLAAARFECPFLVFEGRGKATMGPHIDLQDSHFLALTAAERQFLQSEYDDYGVANSSLACIRSVAVILMLILLIRQVLMVTRDFGMVQELSTFFNVSPR
ncbi:hypothetical protein LOK49_LG11G01296 [Camellia lanceoleosa]|uniref:Uncharacterized protein n=1 Tax=Camellia lanceoleosa TaxID=1840588 RepID=A0ACC0G3Z6_9ERIC|nr:hypothetical protein LOK49_LG11G01296 [Camellia lanceoleosa]